MNFKNILLGMVAIILSICLAFLLFIATNQDALAKVHHTISSFSKMGKVSATKEILNINSNHTAKASEKNAEEQKAEIRYNQLQQNQTKPKHMYSAEECKIMAENYSMQHYGETIQLNQTDENNQDVTFTLQSNDSKQPDEIAINKMGKIEPITATNK
ncbi:hypothetical protein MT340_010475 [Staphylococcus sp. NRL 16/872]|uniref:hypothetical protein n=1 Tax=Staphylococcus sp. NRL 16/872 TaxID=2930131 RepID=UPI001FB3020D|nr:MULTISPECIES: hypothetical protein [unclassified Staphylococcus]MCJ1656948.1 hypothetical protein [Staphylococcus sp. NRL 21/187]MCJ1662695.1 hypothetical protein [Staphylococcus sp. NRL 18/288]MCJ1668800.1 hypothetical protein [Staphylococcus sp. NRL 19/737]WEN69019.1 hypothetical protein MT340_010475 [Staphylococcus sp. NRL 16/872]